MEPCTHRGTHALSYLLFGLVTVVSFFTYVWGYQNPNELYWDENYHIASAQKYLNETFFMEQHPPLGKLLIAAGEALVDVNPPELDRIFLHTDYGKSISEDFSFAGYRLFPVLLAWLTAPLLWLCFFLVFRKGLTATFLSFFYVFDNAFVVHLRGAMLESTLIFGMVCCILFFLLLLKHRPSGKKAQPLWLTTLLSIGFGLSFAITIGSKVTGLIMILLIPILVWSWRKHLRQISMVLITAFATFALVYTAIWQTHFALGKNLHPELSNEGYYQASDELKTHLDAGTIGSLETFPLQLQNHFAFITHYNGGVPKLDLDKPGENGSPWYYWPIGGRAINYRWESSGGNSFAYLYLVSNPAVWWIALLGVVLAYIIALLHPITRRQQHRLDAPYVFWTILLLYTCYMIAISQLTRVMYMYHYLPPLLLSFFLFGMGIHEATKLTSKPKRITVQQAILLGCSVLIFFTHLFYQPLSYYQPIDPDQFKHRDLLPIWNMECKRCE